MPCLRQSSGVFAPASDSLSTPTICCSVNRDFFTRETPVEPFGPGFSTHDQGTSTGQRHLLHPTPSSSTLCRRDIAGELLHHAGKLLRISHFRRCECGT